MRVRLTEVAERAGVGLATVDRVMNERGGVAPPTVKRVLEAARQLGWARDLPTLYRAALRLEVFLGHKEQPLLAGINRAFERLIPTLGREVIIQRTFIDDYSPHRLADAIANTKCNAVIIHGQDGDVVVRAIASVTAAGIPVVTMLSDLPAAPRLAYVGIDHFKAGRCAAFLLWRMARSKSFAVLNHSSAFRAHRERIDGFRDGLNDYGAGEGRMKCLESCDDEASTRLSVSAAFRADPEIGGIYNAGASNRVATQALRGLGEPPLCFIGHDFAGDSYPMLRSGAMTAAIGERVERQAKQAVDVLLAHFAFDVASSQTLTSFRVILKDSIT